MNTPAQIMPLEGKVYDSFDYRMSVL